MNSKTFALEGILLRSLALVRAARLPFGGPIAEWM
jgi:hypothetical protein